MPILTSVRWHDGLYFHKTGVTPATRRVARAAASARGGPLSFANTHAAVPAGCDPKTFPLTTPAALRTAQFAAAPSRRTATRRWLVRVLRRRRTAGPKRKMQAIGLRGPQTTARTVAPQRGVIFGGSRKARPPQQPKISFTRLRLPPRRPAKPHKNLKTHIP